MNPLDLSPHSVEAEQHLIGALLVDNLAWDRIEIDPADCYVEAHRTILKHIAQIIDAGKAADIISVMESLERSGKLEEVGGLAYLGELANGSAGSAGAVRHAEIIRERAVLRALIAAGADIQTMALAPDGGTAEERVASAATRINAIAEGQIRGDGPKVLAQVVHRAVEHLQRVNDGEVVRNRTGLHDLDRKLYSYAPGCLVIVAGRPGMGKTSLAMGAAEYASNDGEPGAVVVFSMEMPSEELALRTMSRVGRIPLPAVITAQMNDGQWSAVTSVIGRLQDLNMHIDDTPALRISQIRSRCNVIRRKAGALKLVVVDYLQLARGEGENRTQEIGSISRGLKALAKEMKCPVIALSQLNRKLEDRPNKRPHMADLRESGDIEQDADLILFVYRDEVYNPDSCDKGTAEIIIGKQRNGPSGETVRVAWLGEYATFGNLSSDWEPAEEAKPQLKVRGFKA